MKVEPIQHDMRTQQYTQVKAIVAKYANLASNTEAAPSRETAWGSAFTMELEGGDTIVPVLGCNYMNQLLARVYKLKSGDNADADVLKEYSEDLSYYIEGLLSSEEEHFLTEKFGLLVDYAFNDGASFNSMQEVRFDGFSEWSGIVAEVLEKKSGKVFIPISDFGCEFARLGHCEITVEEGYANAAMRALACGQSIHRYEASEADAEETPNLWSDIADGCFDVAIVSKAVSHWDAENVQSRFDAAYRIVKEGGEILFSVSRDNLLKEGTSAMRRTLVKNRLLRKVIQLPSGDLLLHVVKKPQDRCIMIDASGMAENGDGHMVDAKALCKQMENAVQTNGSLQSLAKPFFMEELYEEILVPDYYLNGSAGSTSIGELSNICFDLVRSDECASTEKVVWVNNLSHVFSDASFKVAELPNVNMERMRRYQRVEGPAIVMAVTKQNIAIGYTLDSSAFLVPQNLCVLKPNSGIDVMFLACALLDDHAKSQLTKLVYGKGLDSRLIKKWVDFVCIEDSAVKNQQEFIQYATSKDYVEQKKYQDLQERSFKRSMHLRKHALSQNISAFDSLFHTLEYCMSENMGHLKTDMKLSPVSDMTVGDAFTLLRSDLDVICSRVAHLTDEQNWGRCEMIEPQAFMENYEREHRATTFQFKHMWDYFQHNVFGKDIFDKETGKLLFHKGETLNAAWFPKRALTQVLDNIVANACEHGFTDKSRADYVIQTSWNFDGLNMVICVSNNGAPLQESMDANKVLEYGYTTALNQRGHGGIGGGEIAEIMHKFGGDVRVVSTPNSKFTVTYVLSMPLASVY